ncbi:hypothetical protein DM02DRAFT_411464 [Periconia macrospinosa]|uniref:Glycine zipper 2TM domain-containing protein n=1 Tax=Periconia macrospinosa TaxID=97972 RepID=A0A2V1DPM5_9PLEO|nr:hypothetical protein DM02DRAFT_411464 [Periconia macrospinosa]
MALAYFCERNSQSGLGYGSPSSAAPNAFGQSYDQPYYPQAPTPPTSGRSKTHSKPYNPREHVPKDSKQQHFRQTKFLAAVGGALAGGVGGRALGRDKYGTLAGAAAGAFSGPVIMDKFMERKKNKNSDEVALYDGNRPRSHSQKLLEDNVDYYASRSDGEYDRRRRHNQARSRDYRDDYDDYDYDHNRRGRSHRPDRGYSNYDDGRKSRGYSTSPTRSKTGYGLRARSKSIVDRFRAKITGGAVTDGESKYKAHDRRSTRDRSHSRSRRDSYNDYYTDSEEDAQSRRGDRRSWR